jgi:response regulator RpfG family c-di-GMP phosphodiesterase
MADHSIIESEQARISFARDSQPLVAGERRAETALGVGFVAAAGALALLAPHVGHVSLLIAAMYVITMAVAGHVRFDIGSGYTVPTQAVFIPMLFALPATVVPALVALALTVGMLPALVRGTVAPSRILTAPANSWFALGPALVLTLAHDHNPDGRYAILLVALGAQFSFDFATNAVRERVRGGIGFADLVGEVWQIYLVDTVLASVGLAVAFGTLRHAWVVLLVAPLFALLSVFSRERHMRLEQLIELNDAYRGTALALGDVVEADDGYTGAHSRGVVRLALSVAGQLGLDPTRRRNVEFGALLHDVGKIVVPKEIINKPGKLDGAEWAIVKMHTIEGQRMLDRVGGFMREVGVIVRSSHEHWDGSGYPDGLVGEQVPLEARIISACDAFHAMTTTRSYRKAIPLAKAIAELRAHAGSQFDPEVVAAIVEVLGEPAAAGPRPHQQAPDGRESKPASVTEPSREPQLIT